MSLMRTFQKTLASGMTFKKRVSLALGLVLVLGFLGELSGVGITSSFGQDPTNEAGKPVQKNEKGEQPEAIPSYRSKIPRSTCLVDAVALEDVQILKDKNEKLRVDLEKKAADLDRREKILSEELKKLEQARKDLQTAQGMKSQQDEEKLNKLVETVTNMSPKATASLIAALEERLAVDVIYRLDTQRLSKILNIMETDTSSKLSEKMLGVIRSKRSALKNQSYQNSQNNQNNQKGGETNENTRAENLASGSKPGAVAGSIDK